MMNKIVSFGLLLLLSVVTRAQNKMDYWHFSYNSGLDFSGGAPVSMPSAFFPVEGSASIGDGCSALFYTDGDTVYDRTNQPMPNGFGLAGRCEGYPTSNTQSAIIIPLPGSDSIFYIFTVDCIEDSLADGLQYSIVDMSLNGGLGDVTVKNVPLLSPVEEKIAATRHANKCDYWITVHQYYTNAFYSYLLTPGGLNTTPVISATGQVHGDTPQEFQCARGSMKFSPDGSKLACTNTDGIVYLTCGVIFPEMFNFNNSTGILASAYIIDTISDPLYGHPPRPYSVSFSPDNSKLYISTGFAGVSLYQYDISSGDQTLAMLSRTWLNTQIIRAPGGLQIGPDGKIYVAMDSAVVGVIHSPNVAGTACNLVQNGVDLLPGPWGSYGIPNFPDCFYNLNLDVDFNLVPGDVNEISYFTGWSNTGVSWKWNFGDGTYSTLQNPTHVYSAPGIYTVTLTVKDGCDYERHCETIEIGSVGLTGESPIQFELYPNPMSTSATLRVNNPNPNNNFFSITIYNSQGQVVQHITGISETELLIERNDLPRGVYYLVLTSDNSIPVEQKFVID